MCNHTETFYASKGYKLVIVVFIPTLLFSKCRFVAHFSNVVCMKRRPDIPTFYVKVNPFNIVFHMT